MSEIMKIIDERETQKQKTKQRTKNKNQKQKHTQNRTWGGTEAIVKE